MDECKTCGADWSHYDDEDLEQEAPCFCDLMPRAYNEIIREFDAEDITDETEEN